MVALVTVEANAILNASVAGVAYTAPTTPVKIALITTATPSTATAAGSEVSGGSYARQSGAFAAPSGAAIATNAALTYTNMPAVTSVAGIEHWDSAGTPVRRWFGLLTASKITNSGDTFSIASGQLSFQDS
jgi:hypothetical protein